VAAAVAAIHAVAEVPLCIMQCNTNYTGGRENFDHVHLRVLQTYALLFPDAVLGLSDHTRGHATVLGAVALGARAIEKHFTDDNGRTGPDHGFAMTPASWREMVERTRELEAALGTTAKVVEANERDAAVVQRRALRAARDIARGETIDAGAIVALRPCPAGALTPVERTAVEGRTAPRAYATGDHFSFDDWLERAP
jgi:N-acetylneuraminate synthase